MDKHSNENDKYLHPSKPSEYINRWHYLINCQINEIYMWLKGIVYSNQQISYL